MKKFAFINSNGTINHILNTHIVSEYTDGTLHNEYLVKEITDLDITGKYWNGSGFIEIPECPGNFYYWNGSSWVFNREESIAEIVVQRNNKLYLTDWTQMLDAPLTEEQRSAWQVYRQELRDLTDNFTVNEPTVENITWPTAP